MSTNAQSIYIQFTQVLRNPCMWPVLTIVARAFVLSCFSRSPPRWLTLTCPKSLLKCLPRRGPPSSDFSPTALASPRTPHKAATMSRDFLTQQKRKCLMPDFIPST